MSAETDARVGAWLRENNRHAYDRLAADADPFRDIPDGTLIPVFGSPKHWATFVDEYVKAYNKRHARRVEVGWDRVAETTRWTTADVARGHHSATDAAFAPRPLEMPTPGRIVTFVTANGDGVTSPALVLRTRKTTVPGLAEAWRCRHESECRIDAPRCPARGIPAAGEGKTVPIPCRECSDWKRPPAGFVAALPDDYTVDLLVHGLVSDYREYAVPFMEPMTGERATGVSGGKDSLARTWHWPVRS